MSEPTLGARIKAVRGSLGLSQVEFAQLLGVTNVSVNRWEHDRSVPHAATVERILQAGRDGAAILSSPKGSAPARAQFIRTELIGRTHEVERITAALQPGTLVSLVGSAGIGKSTLARATVGAAAEHLGLVLIWVDLGSLSPGEPVAAEIARVIGLRGSGGSSDLDAVANALQTRRILLVLDTCEHVLCGCRKVLNHANLGSTESIMLSTSREPIAIPGEQVITIGSLPIADGQALFQSRATALTDSDLSLVPELCRRLDNVPLAIELAAARTSMLTVPQILERMDRQFDLIEPMAAAIRWSCDLLSPHEASLFRTLGTFHGPFDLSAVEAIAEVPAVVEAMHRLLSQSMVLQEREAGQIRYRLLDSLASYARTWSIACGEEGTAQNRHARHFAAVAITAAEGLRSSSQAAQLATLDAAWPNLAPALHVLVEAGEQSLSLQLATAIGQFCRRRAFVSDGIRALKRTLAAFGELSTPESAAAKVELGLLLVAAGRLDDAERSLKSVLTESGSPADLNRARALDALGLVHRGRSDRPAALVVHIEALEIFQRLGDKHGAAACRLNLALIANIEGDLESAMHGCHDAWSMIKGLDDSWGEATILANLGEIAGRQGKPAEAAGYFEQAMERYRQFGDPEREAAIAANTGEIRMTLGEFVQAERLIMSAVAHFRSTGNRIQLANTLYLEGALQAGLGQQRAGLVAFRESLDLFNQLDDLMDIAYTLEAIARIQVERGDLRVAARIWGGMEAIRERERVPEYPLLDYQTTAQMIRAEMGDEEIAAEFQIGSRMPVTSVIGEALHLGEVTDGPPTLIFRVLTSAPKPRPERYVPTERQLEILRLVASGQTNTEIARDLKISPRTVERHLSTMFGHLGVDRRSAAVAVAAARGLLA